MQAPPQLFLHEQEQANGATVARNDLLIALFAIVDILLLRCSFWAIVVRPSKAIITQAKNAFFTDITSKVVVLVNRKSCRYRKIKRPVGK